jgi:hypothetical protein
VGVEEIAEVVETNDWTAEPFVRAGEEVARLVELEPFQEGYLAATWPGPDGESAAMGNAPAAMDLMGPWAPNAFETDSASGEGITADLGWFPFPAVEGGVGDPNDGLGGSDGWVVGRDAEPEAIEFIHYLTEVEHGTIALLRADGTLHTLVRDDRLRWPDGLSLHDGWLYITDSALQHVILKSRAHIAKHAPYFIYRGRL